MKYKNLFIFLLIILGGIIAQLWKIAVNTKMDLLNDIENGIVMPYSEMLIGSEFIFMNILVVTGVFLLTIIYRVAIKK